MTEMKNNSATKKGVLGTDRSHNRSFTVACIPAYNEEETIAKVIIKTRPHVDRVIVCDDGSTDMTGAIAAELGAFVIKHARNLGYGASLASLFQIAREESAEIMVTLDGDGQHDPDYIPQLIEPIIKNEADIVIGSRLLDKKGNGEGEGVPQYRKNGIRIITGLTKMASYKHITDAQSGLRAYNLRAMETINPTESGMGASTEILIKAKEHSLRLVEVPVTVSYGTKSSKENPLEHAMGVVLSTIKYISIRRPLLFYGVPGLMALAFALTFWLWSIQLFAATGQLTTNITLIAIGATIVGLVLLTTAVLLWVLIAVLRER